MNTERLRTNTPLDRLIGGLEKDIVTNVYGPPGSGKTNIALCAAMSCICGGKKVIFIDTESGFSFERFLQLGGSEKHLKNVMLIEPESWKEQHEKVRGIEKLVAKGDVGLAVVDSLVALYRLELSDENFHLINRQLATQYSVLSRVARKYGVPVLVTNHVYSKQDGTGVEMTSREIAKYWSKALIELKRLERPNQRVAIIRKHRSVSEGRQQPFEITGNGIKEIGRFLR